jgi:segregation and condensation protein B
MSEDRFQLLRLLEGVLFASIEPLPEKSLKARLPEDADLPGLLSELAETYANRGVHLMKTEDRWAFRTAPDLAQRLQIERKVHRKLSRAAIETLAIIAYHQPVTRAEIEEIRGVIISKGTLDLLLEIGWIRPKGRRRTPGRPVTWGTSESFLDHFGLESLDALPGVEELKAAGLLDARPALTALSDRGLLPGAGEIEQERVEGEDDDDADSDLVEGSERELLEETFGEDLLPQEVDLEAAAQNQAEDSDNGDLGEPDGLQESDSGEDAAMFGGDEAAPAADDDLDPDEDDAADDDVAYADDEESEEDDDEEESDDEDSGDDALRHHRQRGTG